MFISQINLNGKKNYRMSSLHKAPNINEQWAMTHTILKYSDRILQIIINLVCYLYWEICLKKKRKKKPLAECKLIHLSQSYTGGFCATCYCHTSKQAIFQIKLKKITQKPRREKNEKGEKSCSLFNALFLLENALQVCLNSIL